MRWSPLPSSSGTRSIVFPRVTQALARRRTALHSEFGDGQANERSGERKSAVRGATSKEGVPREGDSGKRDVVGEGNTGKEEGEKPERPE